MFNNNPTIATIVSRFIRLARDVNKERHLLLLLLLLPPTGINPTRLACAAFEA